MTPDSLFLTLIIKMMHWKLRGSEEGKGTWDIHSFPKHVAHCLGPRCKAVVGESVGAAHSPEGTLRTCTHCSPKGQGLWPVGLMEATCFGEAKGRKNTSYLLSLSPLSFALMTLKSLLFLLSQLGFHGNRRGSVITLLK